MKKLLFIICLFTCTTSFAQNLSFEETVKYINDKIKCCSYREENKNIVIEAFKNGDIKWKSGNTNHKINLFDLTLNTNASVRISEGFEKVVKKANGLLLLSHDYGGATGYFIYFIINKKGDYLYLPDFQQDIDAERVYNALQHLREVCTKEKDPFDN